MPTRNAGAPRWPAWPSRLARRLVFNLLAAIRPLVFATSGLLLAIGILGLLAGLVIAHGRPPLHFALPALVIVTGLLALERLYDGLLGWLAAY